MTDTNQSPNASIRSGASLTDDMVRLAANEERLSAKIVGYFFGLILIVGVVLLVEAFIRSNNPLPGDADNYNLVGMLGGIFAIGLGAVGMWACRRANKKIGDVLNKH